MAFCTNCGKKIPDDIKFCPECGTRVMAEEPVPAVVEVPVEEPVPVEQPAPAEVHAPVEEPAPVEETVPVEETAAVTQVEEEPEAEGAGLFPVGEDGLEYVKYVPVAAPVAAAAPAAVSEAAPEAAPTTPAAERPAKAQKEPKKGIAKFLPWILIGGGAALAALIGVIVLVVSLFAKLGGAEGGNADPTLGLYTGVYAEMMGYEVAVEDIWADGVTIELKEKGKCVVTLNGAKSKGKWTLEEEEITVKAGALDCAGTLEEGEMTLDNVMNMGVMLTLTKDGAEFDGPGGLEDPGVIADDGPLTEVQEKWNGTWYGVISFMECDGKYADHDYMQYDAYMGVELDENGAGRVKVWADPNLPAFAEAEVEVIGDAMYFRSGTVCGGEMDTANWMFTLVPDSEDRYVMPWDQMEDEDGDTYEYMVFMKKWGASWASEMENYEITPPYVEAYEEYIAAGIEPVELNMDAPVAASPDEAVAGMFAAGAVTREISVPSVWYGWVMLQDWWGDGEGEPMYDAWAFVDTDSDGRPFVDIKLDGYPDSAFMSMYMHLEDGNTCIVPEIGEGDAWFNDTYLTPGEDDNYRMYLLEDGTLRTEFTYESYTGEYGCEVVMCLRVDGTEWDEENDLLPLRYDEYKAALGAKTEGAPAEEEPAAAAGGDGIVSLEQLKAGLDGVHNDSGVRTYETVRAHFGGVDGLVDDWDPDFHSYWWKTEDGSEKVVVSFIVKDDGVEYYSGMSWSDGLND